MALPFSFFLETIVGCLGALLGLYAETNRELGNI
jgi:hypothetical protein